MFSISAMSLCCVEITQSSADKNFLDIVVVKSAMYKVTNNGDKTVPCGRPLIRRPEMFCRITCGLLV